MHTKVEERDVPSAIDKRTSKSSKSLIEISQTENDEVLKKFKTQREGLSSAEAELRLKQFGPNIIAQEKKKSIFVKTFDIFIDPLILVLAFLAIISYVTNDLPATAIISIMVSVSVVLRLYQETQSDNAADKLKKMITTTSTIMRNGKKQEIPMSLIVPGDIILLSAGDLIPADIRLLSSKDLYSNRAALTGETMPVEKHSKSEQRNITSPLELFNICHMGTTVESGTAVGVVVVTGGQTYLGSIAQDMTTTKTMTNFDKGIRDYTWLLIKIMCVVAPLVFLINAVTKGNIFEAFLFSLSVIVGLTPEMLPMIVNVNLAKGAVKMSAKKVIVKRLNSIQNFGAMDVLCTDKTGTLTQGKIILEKHLNVLGEEDNEEVLKYAYLNSFYQTGLKNVLDEAVLGHLELHSKLKVDEEYKKIDEIPFDFVRKRMSVVVEGGALDHRLLICKGAVEEIIEQSIMAEVNRGLIKLDKELKAKAIKISKNLNKKGFRVIAVAYRAVDLRKTYAKEDEKELILAGFIGFLDPPKDSAAEAIKKLIQNGVEIKVLTGDNELVTQHICKHVGLKVNKILLGGQIESMNEEELVANVGKTTIFAKLSPNHKKRIVEAIKKNGHVVGFMGDGINDAPALKTADVGICVDSAVDIAKESASIILLEKSLLVLEEGVIEGRKVFGNIVKYIKMAASSNFGNIFSIVGASLFLPFLPMQPIQILVNNLLYDMSQTAIPTDSVDKEWTQKPRKWDMAKIFKFILFIGPISSIFDYITFFVMIFMFGGLDNPSLFQTGWFIESLLTQTIVIHIIRTNKVPFLQSRASWPLILTTIVICAIGIYLPLSEAAGPLGFAPLPLLYWPILFVILVGYVFVTQFVKSWFVKKYELTNN